MFRLFECCALSFFERFVLSFSLKIERFVSDSAEIWICGLYWFSIGKVEAGKKLGYHTHQSHAGVYIFLIEGEIIVDGEVMKRRDGMGIYDTNNFELETLKDSHILLIEVPM